jgi:hypothetical protein
MTKLKRYKSPGSDEISAELIQAGGETLRSKIHKLINAIWNKEVFPDQWEESIIVPVHKGDNYCGISLLSTSYKILSNILPSRLSAYIYIYIYICIYIDEIIGDHQCGFRRNRSNTDQIFCIHKKIGVQRDSTSVNKVKVEAIRRLQESL